MWFKEFNDHLDDIRHGRDHDRNFMNSSKAQHIVDLHKAQEWLEVIDSLEKSNNHMREMDVMLRDKNNEITKQRKIIDAYIEKFGKYKVSQKNGFSMDKEIIIPNTDHEIFYNKVFINPDYPRDHVNDGKKINVSIDVEDSGWIITSRKVMDIKPKVVSDNKKKKW